MNKTALLAALLLISAGCKTAPRQPNSASVQPAAQTQPAPQNTHNTPQPSETPKPASTPDKKETFVIPAKEQTTALQKEEITEPEKKAEPSLAGASQSTPVLPPDTPVFEDEELINTAGRLLNPYAYLPADANLKTGAPWDGEQLKYGIYYAFIKAGTAYIRNRGVVDIDGEKAYLIQTSAFSATVIDAFFKVRDINQSWIDTQTFYSRGYGQSVREGSYKRDEWVKFAPEEKRYYGQIKKKDPSPREISGELTTPVADFLSALYFVRAQPLEVGKDVVFDIVNREKQYPLIVKVLRKEKVKTPAGEFHCIVVEPQLRGEGIFVSKGKSLTVWLTDDEYRMPVKMKTEVFIGSVSASLLEYKRL